MLMSSLPPTQVEMNAIRRKRTAVGRPQKGTERIQDLSKGQASVAASWADAFRVAAAERGDTSDNAPAKSNANARIASSREDALVGAGAALKDETAA